MLLIEPKNTTSIALILSVLPIVVGTKEVGIRYFLVIIGTATLYLIARLFLFLRNIGGSILHVFHA